MNFKTNVTSFVYTLRVGLLGLGARSWVGIGLADKGCVFYCNRLFCIRVNVEKERPKIILRDLAQLNVTQNCCKYY